MQGTTTILLRYEQLWSWCTVEVATALFLVWICTLVLWCAFATRARKALAYYRKKADSISGPQLYQAKHVADNEHFDSIIIGSGVGGLSAASLLAQHGHKVLVLEQHNQAGGACHTFEHSGYRFATGIHYVCEMGVSKKDPKYKNSFKRILDSVTPPGDPVVWDRIRDDPMESIVFGPPNSTSENRLFHACSGELALKARLNSRFPLEREAIDQYFKLVHKARELAFPRAILFKVLPLKISTFLIQNGLHLLLDGGYHELASVTVQQGLEKLTQNKELQAILSYHWGDYGCEPSKASFLMNLLTTAVFLDGGFYPHGGPATIPQKMIKEIYTYGGKVLVKAPVKTILLDGKSHPKVKGVQMEDGRIIHSKRVVSDAGLINTVKHLLPDESLVNIDFAKVDGDTENKLHSGASAITLFVGFEGHWRHDFNLPAQHVWIYSQHDTSAAFDKIKAMSLEEALECDPCDLSPIFVGNPCSKDKTWETTHADKSVLEIIWLGPKWSWFEPFLESYDPKTKSYGTAYESIKDRFAAKIWERVVQVLNDNSSFKAKLPSGLDKLPLVQVGTPLTLKHFLRSEDGAVYGLDHDTKRFEPETFFLRLRPRVPEVSGLYLSGQDVAGDSLVGASVGGLLCAAQVLNVLDPFSLLRS